MSCSCPFLYSYTFPIRGTLCSGGFAPRPIAILKHRGRPRDDVAREIAEIGARNVRIRGSSCEAAPAAKAVQK